MSGQPRFVGRARELAELRRYVADAARGRGLAVAIEGPAGIGKTRLAGAVADHADGDGHAVHWATCWEGPGCPALWPWTQVARGVRTSARAAPDDYAPPDQRRGNTVGEWLSELYRNPANEDVPLSQAMDGIFRRLDLEPLDMDGNPRR